MNEMVTSLGDVALKFVTPTTLLQFAVPWAPSTSCGKLSMSVDVDAGRALTTAHDGAAMKSRAITVAANGLPWEHAQVMRMCVTIEKSSTLGKSAETCPLKNPLARIN